MGLGPVILLGIAAGILSVEIQRWRGDRECPAGQRARVPADGRLLFLARNTRRAERVGFAALLAEGATGPVASAGSLRMRIYTPRVVADRIMMQDDFVRLHKFLLETDAISDISDDVREVVEKEWPELVHKLPPKKPNA